MIRTSKHILKYSNKVKLSKLDEMFELYRKQLGYYLELIKSNELPLKLNLSSKELPNYVINHSRYKQLIYKKASEIFRGQLVKVRKRCWNKYKKLFYKCNKNNNHKNFTSKLFNQLNINYDKRAKIDLKNVQILLDQRFFDIKSGKSFNQFVRVKLPIFKESTKRLENICLPIKHHKHSNKFKEWNRRKSIQIQNKDGKYYLCYFYEKDEVKNNKKENVIGIDIGYKKLISDSNGVHYGTKLEKIYQKIANKKRGSKKYFKAIQHKKNQTNRVVNYFVKLNEPDIVYGQNLKDVKKQSKLYRKFNNKLQYWSYKQVIDKLNKLSQEKGFLFELVEPAYTSQTCSCCGNINKNNRKGQIYQCDSCGCLIDADTNASINILHRGVYSPSNNKN